MGRSGCYLITCEVDGRIYVGSTMNLDRRWKEHVNLLRRGVHHSRFLQRCWTKYGADKFNFEPVLFCKKSDVLFYEQRLIDGLKPAYNSRPNAASQLGYRHREESKLRMAEAARRTRNFTGHSHSEESKKKISESRKGKGGGPRTAERCANISAALKGRPHSEDRKQKIRETLTGTSTGRGSLIPEQVREIRRLREQGLGKCRIAKALGINISTADTVIGGHAYGWVK